MPLVQLYSAVLSLIEMLSSLQKAELGRYHYTNSTSALLKLTCDVHILKLCC